MSEHLLRQRQIQRHQKNRPVNRMETDNIFSDQVQICRPVLVEQIAGTIRIVTNLGDIVGQGIQPYIDHMLRVKIYRNSPAEGGTGNTQILQPRQQEVVHHLILSGYRLDEIRMGVDVINQAVCILAHFEEVCLLLCRLYLTATVRTLAVHQLGLRPEGLTGCTVQALIRALVDISLIVQFLKDFLHALLVILVCGADKIIIGCIDQIPDSLYLAGYLIHIFLRCNTGSLCLFLNLLTMLVSSSLEINVIALCTLIPCNGICKNDLVGISDMRFA